MWKIYGTGIKNSRPWDDGGGPRSMWKKREQCNPSGPTEMNERLSFRIFFIVHDAVHTAQPRLAYDAVAAASIHCSSLSVYITPFKLLRTQNHNPVEHAPLAVDCCDFERSSHVHNPFQSMGAIAFPLSKYSSPLTLALAKNSARSRCIFVCVAASD